MLACTPLPPSSPRLGCGRLPPRYVGSTPPSGEGNLLGRERCSTGRSAGGPHRWAAAAVSPPPQAPPPVPARPMEERHCGVGRSSYCLARLRPHLWRAAHSAHSMPMGDLPGRESTLVTSWSWRDQPPAAPTRQRRLPRHRRHRLQGGHQSPRPALRARERVAPLLPRRLLWRAASSRTSSRPTRSGGSGPSASASQRQTSQRCTASTASTTSRTATSTPSGIRATARCTRRALSSAAPLYSPRERSRRRAASSTTACACRPGGGCRASSTLRRVPS